MWLLSQFSPNFNNFFVQFHTLFSQKLSQGPGGVQNDQISLDIHAISDLQGQGIPPTDDLPKYKYTADDSGQYSMYMLFYPTKCFFWGGGYIGITLSFHISHKHNSLSDELILTKLNTAVVKCTT